MGAGAGSKPGSAGAPDQGQPDPGGCTCICARRGVLRHQRASHFALQASAAHMHIYYNYNTKPAPAAGPSTSSRILFSHSPLRCESALSSGYVTTWGLCIWVNGIVRIRARVRGCPSIYIYSKFPRHFAVRAADSASQGPQPPIANAAWKPHAMALETLVASRRYRPAPRLLTGHGKFKLTGASAFGF